MRFLEILTEMNVSNLDTIKADFSNMLSQIAANTQYEIPKPLFELIVKRATKAMQNDDAGNMVTKRALRASDLDDNAPAWLRTSLERGDAVYEITFKQGFEDRLRHVVDWLRTDQNAGRTVKAAPEQDFLGHLAKAADDFFEEYNAANAKAAEEKQKKEEVHSEPGREVVMTFRKNPKNNQISLFKESDLSDNTNGPVICFWAKLTSDQALNREGVLMGHCVGSFADRVASQHCVIYSLRNMKNEPHVTVELNNVDTPTIEQVKGKGNRPPPGRYAVYVKDFLNAMGIEASYSGTRDLKGLGLLTHDGKYGTILEVGGNIIAAFDNGDSIRSLNNSGEMLYVEKDGTTPFEFEFNPFEFEFNQDRHPIFGAYFRISEVSFYRKEVSRFPIYARNMIKYLNENKLGGLTKIFEEIGVFYDQRKSIWGTRKELAEDLFDYKGVNVSRLARDVFFTDAKDTIFAEASFYNSAILRDINVVNECEATSLIPELILEFCNRVIKDQMPNKNARDYISDFGVFWNNYKNAYTSVPDEKSIIFKSSLGHVNLYMNRLFFFDASKRLIASYYVGKSSPPYTIEWWGDSSWMRTFGQSHITDLLKLLSDIGKQSGSSLIKIAELARSMARERGFYLEKGRLIPLGDIEKDYNLGNGYKAAVRVQDNGTKTVSLSKSNEKIAYAYVDDEGITQSINYETVEEDRGRYVENVPKFDQNVVRPYIAAMLNAAGVKMSMIDALGQYLVVNKANKFVAIDSQKNKLIHQFINGRIDLGNGFIFRRSFSLNSKVFRGRLDQENGNWTERRFGDLEYIDEDDRDSERPYGRNVCIIEWRSYENDLTYHMPKRQPDGVTRQQVIKVVSKFMQIYHEKIEPFINLNVVDPNKEG